jgi:asparagine synthase (glutamine-hydrolysing)
MCADVPLGAFLSGGIDSSAVVALMAGVSTEKVKTCSIGFQDRAHDETPYAREVAGLFGTDHREYQVQENLPQTVLRQARFFDEPFADSSSVPTYHVSRLARQDVTVALAGDGGDESFGGYEKYTVDRRENQVRQYVPQPVLRLLQGAAQGRPGVVARKLRTLTGGALADPSLAFFRTNSFIEDEQLQGLLGEGLSRAVSGYDPAQHTIRTWEKVRGADHVTGMLYTDLKTYLPDDILVKVDRMSMAHSLEVRAPLLDHRIIEFAASLPSSWKIHGSTKKYLLKQAFKKVLPPGIIHRRKHGFTVPLERWFREELRTLAGEYLLGAELAEFFDPGYLRGIWTAHQEGKADHGTLLWSLLSFALWQREYLGGTR